MKIKNKTCKWQKCAGVRVLPWRTVEVPDNAQVDEKIFEIIGKKIIVKEKKYDLKSGKKIGE